MQAKNILLVKFLLKSDTVCSDFANKLNTVKSEMAENKTEKQAEMLRHNLVLRKKQIEERNRIAAEKKQNKKSDGKELAPNSRED